MLDALGATRELARCASAADERLGRVAWLGEGLATVLTDAGPVRCGAGGALLSRIAADPVEAPCPGDWVVLRAWPDHRHTLERVLPRRTALRSPGHVESVAAEAGTGGPRPAEPRDPLLAANVDLVGLVLGAGASREPERLAALVAWASESGARALALPLPGSWRPRAAREAAGDGAAVVPVDPATGAGLSRLRRLTGRAGTLALYGEPTGCRALAAALVGAEVLGAGSAAGPHAPAGSAAVLRLLPGSGALVEAGGVEAAAPWWGALPDAPPRPWNA